MEAFFGFVLLVVVFFLATKWPVERDTESTTLSEEKPPKPLGYSKPFERKTATAPKIATTILGKAFIIDGDSLVIEKTQVRLFGVDAPELNHPYGKNAKWALVNLCKGQVVKAEVTEVDHFGRTVARCYLEDGRDLSAEMVKLGMALDWPKFSGGDYRSLETSDARKKLWLADARQKGRMHVWEKYEARQNAGSK